MAGEVRGSGSGCDSDLGGNDQSVNRCFCYKPGKGHLDKAMSPPLNHDWRERNTKIRHIDPRIRNFFSRHPFRVAAHDRIWVPLLDGDELGGGERLAPSEGFDWKEVRIKIQNEDVEAGAETACGGFEGSIAVHITRAKRSGETRGGGEVGGETLLPCVVYFHGGGMSHYSCFLKNWRTLARMIASKGVVVVMPDVRAPSIFFYSVSSLSLPIFAFPLSLVALFLFSNHERRQFRNSETPSRTGEAIGPFPAGLNDCVATLRWVHTNAAMLDVDSNRIIVAGESGGANLAVASALHLGRRFLNGKKGAEEARDATLESEMIVKGVFAACPYLLGCIGNGTGFPSHVENAGIMLDYPIIPESNIQSLYGHSEAKGSRLHTENVIEAWPGYCTAKDLRARHFPPCEVVVNEL